MTLKQLSAVHIQSLHSADGILLGSRSKDRLLVINLASVPGGQLVNSPTAQSLGRCASCYGKNDIIKYINRRLTSTMAIDQDLNTNDNHLWGPIELVDWHQTPHITNHIATEQDVNDGRAVFYIDTEGKDHKILDIKIPSVAYQIDNETKERTLVIVIQGEKVDNEEIVGVRYLDGGNGVCMLSELDFAEDPT